MEDDRDLVGSGERSSVAVALQPRLVPKVTSENPMVIGDDELVGEPLRRGGYAVRQLPFRAPHTHLNGMDDSGRVANGATRAVTNVQMPNNAIAMMGNVSYRTASSSECRGSRDRGGERPASADACQMGSARKKRPSLRLRSATTEISQQADLGAVVGVLELDQADEHRQPYVFARVRWS